MKITIGIFKKNLLYENFEKTHYKNFFKNLQYEKFEKTILRIFKKNFTI